MANFPTYADNVRAYIAAAVTTGATSITVQAGQGARFPAIAAGRYLPCIITNVTGVSEQVNITAISTDTLTVTRAVNGTTALEWGLGDEIFIAQRAGELNDYVPRKEEWASQDPASAGSSDTYAVGDVVWNSEPSSTASIGWVCTVAGTPGTWKAFGTIA